jgi:hypothetical protein
MQNSETEVIQTENNYDSKKKGYIYFLRKKLSEEEAKHYQDSFKIYKIGFTYRKVKESR